MRFLKRQSTLARRPKGRGIHFTEDQIAVVDTTKTLLVPRGTTEQRPFIGSEGEMRYNTTIDNFEFYRDGAWREVRYREPDTQPGIVQQNLGLGDDVETDFGPLESGDSLYPVPIAPQNILVFVENVFQIATTNYSLVQNPSGKQPGWYLRFGTAPPDGKSVTVLHNFDK